MSARPLRDVDADEARAAIFGLLHLQRPHRPHAPRSSPHSGRSARTATTAARWARSSPTDEVGDLRDGLRVQTRVNGTTVQDGNTRDMIFDVADILALVSKTFTLNPGDVIATGTPEGVGYVRNPPWLLTDGDVVEVEVDRLGVLRTPIVGNGD